LRKSRQPTEKHKPTIRIGSLSEFTTQRNNANDHTERGLRLIDDSMSEDGYVAPMTSANDGEVIDGSARLERAFDRFDGEAIIIEHDGQRPIIAKRIDIPDAEQEIAKRISLRANRIAQVDLSWNPEVIASLNLSDPKLVKGMFSDIELADLLMKVPNFEPTSADDQGRLDERGKVKCPECGYEFQAQT